VAGTELGELSLVGAPYVARAMSALHRARSLALDDRLAALDKAALLFASASVGGLSVAEYQYLTCRASGLNISAIRKATDQLAERIELAYHNAQRARPNGTVASSRDPNAHTGTAVWVRRGSVFGVHAAGNHPGVHAGWLEALALGYRVAVRPSRREPLTAHRLVLALWSAGFGRDEVVLLPTDHDAADELISSADLSMVYGGDEVIRKFAGSPHVLPQGPGRSKILLTAGVDWRDYAAFIADSVSHGGGTACTNTTAVFVEDYATEVAEAVAERLAKLPALPPENEEALLPVLPLSAARRVEGYLRRVATGTTPFLGGQGIVEELGDGSACLRPSVHLLDAPGKAQASVELAFPCVWIAPWKPDCGVAPLRNTLALTVLGGTDGLHEQLIEEPTIRNVYAGPCPTYWSAPGIPHDSYLADFLMESKGFISL
jgi:acyl-CoA reductase-like NAD-dependent aldehyde dehydrogenase